MWAKKQLTAATLVAMSFGLMGCEMPPQNGLGFFGDGWPKEEQAMTRAQVREIEIRLRNLGYFRGTMDGIITERTRTAIRGYQGAVGTTQNGYVTAALLNSLRGDPASAKPPAAAPRRQAPRVVQQPVQPPVQQPPAQVTPPPQFEVPGGGDGGDDGGSWG